MIAKSELLEEPDLVSLSAVGMAREALRLAHGALVEAGFVLDTAKAASERARLFLTGAVERRDQFREIDRSVAVDRSQEVKADLLAGRAPTFADVPGLSRNAAALAEAESRVAAAEIACRDIEAAEGEAQADVNRARDELRQAAQSLMLAEADALAERIAELEGEALGLRVRLGGGSMCPIATMSLPLSETLARVLRETDERFGDLILRNGLLWDGVKDAASGWRNYLDSLLADPDATLSVDEPQPAPAIAAE